MKTRFFLGIMIMLMSAFSTAAAQDFERSSWRIIPRVGMSRTTLLHQQSIPEVGAVINSEARNGITVGVDVERMLTPSLSFMPGLHYMQQGCRFPDYGSDAMRQTDADIRTHYLALPLRLRWWIVAGFSVATGIQAAYLLSSNSRLTLHLPNEGETPMSSDIISLCHRVDFAVPMEVYYSFGNVELGVAYNLSINKFHRSMLSESRVRNSVLRFTLGYRFEL